jgi:hypothetical protein
MSQPLADEDLFLYGLQSDEQHRLSDDFEGDAKSASADAGDQLWWYCRHCQLANLESSISCVALCGKARGDADSGLFASGMSDARPSGRARPRGAQASDFASDAHARTTLDNILLKFVTLNRVTSSAPDTAQLWSLQSAWIDAAGSMSMADYGRRVDWDIAGVESNDIQFLNMIDAIKQRQSRLHEALAVRDDDSVSGAAQGSTDDVALQRGVPGERSGSGASLSDTLGEQDEAVKSPGTLRSALSTIRIPGHTVMESVDVLAFHYHDIRQSLERQFRIRLEQTGSKTVGTTTVFSVCVTAETQSELNQAMAELRQQLARKMQGILLPRLLHTAPAPNIGNVFVFVDHSNVYVRVGATAGYIDVAAVDNWLLNSRKKIKGYVASTMPEGVKQAWASLGYGVAAPSQLLMNTCDPQLTDADTNVDEFLHAQIYDTIMDVQYAAERGVIVLASGDGNPNNGRSTFPKCCAAALRQGWQVEVCSWAQSLSTIFVQMAALSDGAMQIRLYSEKFLTAAFPASQSTGTTSATAPAYFPPVRTQQAPPMKPGPPYQNPRLSPPMSPPLARAPMSPPLARAPMSPVLLLPPPPPLLPQSSLSSFLPAASQARTLEEEVLRVEEVVKANMYRGGLIGAMIHKEYKKRFPGSQLQLVFDGVHYKAKQLIEMSPNILTDIQNTQPVYKLRPS